jgi:hypothetical protein
MGNYPCENGIDNTLIIRYQCLKSGNLKILDNIDNGLELEMAKCFIKNKSAVS